MCDILLDVSTPFGLERW